MKYQDGDVLAAPAPCVIAHGCNALGVMGAGLANQVRLIYPLAFQTYLRSRYRLGSCSLAKVGEQKWIANLITQPTVGRKGIHTDHNAVRLALINMIALMEGEGIPIDTPIYVPSGMCCGLGGGDWGIVKGILSDCERLYGVKITIVRYTP
jgi:O-acetyl-ADP-ribose deacetylase (regulator of RNase III)